MRSRRHVRRPPDLTSLFDVLFIVVFAALIRAAAVENAAAHPPAPPRPAGPTTPPVVEALRRRAVADLYAVLVALPPLVVRITRDGTVEAIEVDGKRLALVVPLLEPSADREAGVTYAADRAADLRVCRIAARRLGTADLSRYLVIMAIALDEAPEALVYGLGTDVALCRSEQHAQATIVDSATLAGPSAVPPAPPIAQPAAGAPALPTPASPTSPVPTSPRGTP